MATADELLSDALRLPTEDRARLAHELLLSLDEETEEAGAEEAWAEEIARRAEEVLSGKVKTVSWEEMEARIAAQLRERRGP